MLGVHPVLALFLWFHIAIAKDIWLRGFTSLFWTSSLVTPNNKYLYIDGGEIWNGTEDSKTSGFIFQSTISIDLSKSWTNASLPVNFYTLKPMSFPYARWPVLWYSENKIYSWAGAQYYAFLGDDNTAWGFSPPHGYFNRIQSAASSKALWQLTTDDQGRAMGQWEASPDAVQPIGVTPAPAISMATTINNVLYSLGGTDQSYTLPGLAKFNGKTWNNITAQPVSYAAWGQAIAAPSFGSQGAIIFIGGFLTSKPVFRAQIPVDDTGIRDMAKISVYDIEHEKFYLQHATGHIPAPRYSFCATGVTDRQGHLDIFIYGGGTVGSDFSVLSDMYILSIPSFHWTRINTDKAKAPIREEHSCHVIGNRQMISVGGTDGTGGSGGQVPAKPDPWTNGIGIFDLSSLSWTSSYNPDAEPYVRAHELVSSLSGREFPSKWSSPELQNLFTKQSSNKSNDGTLKSSSVSPSTAKSESQSKSQSSSGISAGAVTGIVVGLVVLFALTGTAVWLFFRHRRKHEERQRLPPDKDTGQHLVCGVGDGKVQGQALPYDYCRDEKPGIRERHELPGDSTHGELEDSGRPELPSSPKRQAWEIESRSINGTIVASSKNTIRSTSGRTSNTPSRPYRLAGH